ncbi:carboxymuconolactone decarboxylase family protein [Bacillus sp. 1P02SD]|uniref:carboxymuconolactone decarboxylase family protein n=1 Tax=Bacillus sp. 1P02SD TaxID=3132264 RepID=UPI0039A1565E
MEKQNEIRNWREVVKEYDEEMHEKLVSYIGHILERESTIPRKYKELILVAVSTGIRFESSIESHAKGALNHGATKEEVFEAMSLSALSAGFTAMIEGTKVLDRL